MFGESNKSKLILNNAIPEKNNNIKNNLNNHSHTHNHNLIKPNFNNATQKGRSIAKKLRKFMLKNIKSKKIVVEPEDLEFLQIIKSKNAYIESFSANQVFLQWSFKSELSNNLTIVIMYLI